MRGPAYTRRPRDELERKVDEFIKLLRIGMGAARRTGVESEGQEYVRTTVLIENSAWKTSPQSCGRGEAHDFRG